MKYEGPNSYQSKDMPNIKVFADKQTDKPINGRKNGQAKNYMPQFIGAGAQKCSKM